MTAQLPGRQVSFPARSITGEQQTQTGLLHLPAAPAPQGGYPVVVYGHMTTGGSDSSAPSTAGPGHVEWRRMSQGDALCKRLLDAGVAVLRPDYEGLGSPGVHPYLIGASLAESMRAIFAARESFDASLGDRFVYAGHSEGSVAALHASVAEAPDDKAQLVGTSAFTPVTRMENSIGLSLKMGKKFPGANVVSSLVGLMLSGAATEDPRLKELIETDGLSDAAKRAWPDLNEKTLVELMRKDSWGGFGPKDIGGVAQEELWERLFASFQRNEVANLKPRPGQPPLRIDAAMFDEVAPAPYTRALIKAYRENGWDLTVKWWPMHHSGSMREQYAPSEAADWIAHLFTSR